jgi:hypothetical protein
VFELARLMGTSVAMIDRTYGHLARGHAERARERLNRRPSIVTEDAAEQAGEWTSARRFGPYLPASTRGQECG